LTPPGKSQGLTQSQALTGQEDQSQTLTGQEDQSQTLTGQEDQSQTLTGQKTRTFNESIGILLRSYTRAINKQEGFTGTLFRKETKAECLNCPNGITPAFISGSGTTHITHRTPEQQYPQLCFNYIHQNPVKAKLVADAVDWEFSSARDYAGLRDGKMVNKEVAGEYVKVN
jgi:putative transposase